MAMNRREFRGENMSHIRVFEKRSPNSLKLKKVRQVKSKVKNMIIIFSNIKGIVHEDFILSGQTVNSTYYCDILW
jgi:hypothetical protein